MQAHTHLPRGVPQEKAVRKKRSENCLNYFQFMFMSSIYRSPRNGGLARHGELASLFADIDVLDERAGSSPAPLNSTLRAFISGAATCRAEGQASWAPSHDCKPHGQVPKATTLDSRELKPRSPELAEA